MVTLDAVRAHNSNLKASGSELVAVFVGATSGIGETTAREFVRNTLRPKVYIIGRNEVQATSIIDELKKLNADSKLEFIKSDVTLLREVDRVCDEIKAKEESINVLFLSPGILTTKGRDETIEGLDKKFNLHYYARVRFTMNLMPLLTISADGGRLSRVVTVLAPGTEGHINLDDLALKKTYSIGACATHAGTMNSFIVEEFARRHPGVCFIHASPGVVKTGLLRNHNMFLQMGVSALTVLMKPWIVPLDQSGERHLYAATSPTYPPQNAKVKDDAVMGSAGEKGSGAYLIDCEGTPNAREKIMREYRSKGIGQVIWDHTMDVFAKVCQGDNGKY